MPRMFIRVELHGNADDATYEKLHAFMHERNWFRRTDSKTGIGTMSVNMPSATYTGITSTDPITIASVLAASVKANIWAKATVLAMNTGESWAIDGDLIR